MNCSVCGLIPNYLNKAARHSFKKKKTLFQEFISVSKTKIYAPVEQILVGKKALKIKII